MKRFLAFFLIFVLGTTTFAKEVEEPGNLYAQSAVLMDADSGRVLFGKNADEVMAMASTTKIMTCILALEKGKVDEVVTASEEAAVQPKVHLGMKEGEKFYLEDLLYSLMLESHNDSAVAIAEHLAGSVEKFADMMNEKAKEIGCQNTYFITPNGLDAVDEKGIHATTATELAKMMRYCIRKSPKKEEFLKITQTANHTFSDVSGKRTFHCSNHNSFLTMMDGALSGKTGFTGKAGYCYVGALEQDGRTFIVALLACGWPNNKNYKWKDTKELMEYALEHYTYQNVYEKLELPGIIVEDGIAESDALFESATASVEVEADKNELQILLSEWEEVDVKTDYPDTLGAPVRKGTQIGKVVYELSGTEIQSFPIVVKEDVRKKDLKWYFTKVLKLYLKI